MRKTLSIITLAILASFGFSSCNKIESEIKDTSDRFLVLCEGSINQNNATLSVVTVNGNLVTDFETVNDYALGETGQDIVEFNDGYAIAVTGSKRVYLTDKELKVYQIVEPKVGEDACSPRNLAVDGNTLYATLYEGYICKINADGSYRTTDVGPNPEGLVIRGNFAYVANSGGYVPGFNDTVSKVDLENFEQVDELKIGLNPVNIEVIGELIYLQCAGNYAEVTPCVYTIDMDDKAAKIDDTEGADDLAVLSDGSVGILIKSYGADWKTVGSVRQCTTSDVKTLMTDRENAYSLSAGDGEFYLGCSDYTTTGEIAVYHNNGDHKYTFSAHGFNPRKVIAL